MAARVLAAGSLLAAAAQASPVANGTASGAIVYTTEVLTALTTYCPAATTLVHGSKTYTVTEATTLTITDCPCTVSKPQGAPTPSAPSSPANKCAMECTEAYNACRVKPQANMSYCASVYASCLGYSPFNGEGSLVTPTACSSQASATAPATTPTGVMYTTEVVTELTTYCPQATTLTHGNKTYTVTEPTTLTITDCPCTISKPHPGPSQPPAPGHPDCPAECSAAYNKCRTSGSANMATCASNYASCLGYSPFGPDGSLITPTACSKTPAGPTSAPVQPPKPTETLPPKDCAGMCHKKYNECRSGANAVMASCAGDFASCLGYSPFGPDGSLVVPTACSTGATGVTVPATSTPTGTSPSGTSPSGPVVTPPGSGAGRMAPGALLVLGAIALL